jgi:CBS-domain-containing membrane protein
MSSSRPTVPPFNFDIDHYLNHIIPRPRLHLLPSPVSRLLGYRKTPQAPIGNLLIYAWSFIGAFGGIALTCYIFHVLPFPDNTHRSIIIGSLGASAILEYNAITSPLAQPRNVILGQTLSALIGIAITKGFQCYDDFENIRWLAGALAVATSSVVMGVTKTIHPPAGATALLAATMQEITDLDWFLIPLVLLGSVIILVVACLVNNIQRQFPLYWWTEHELGPTEKATEDLEKQNSISSIELRPGEEYAINHADGETLVLKAEELTQEEKTFLESLKARIRMESDSESS